MNSATMAVAPCKKACGACPSGARMAHRRTCIGAGLLALSGAAVAIIHPIGVIPTIVGAIWLVGSGVVGPRK